MREACEIWERRRGERGGMERIYAWVTEQDREREVAVINTRARGFPGPGGLAV